MSDCCASPKDFEQHLNRYACPENGKHCIEVPYNTVLHHVKEPWNLRPKEQAYYFCDDPECDVVYVGIDGFTIRKNQLRTKVGIKEASDDTLICYCFGVSKSVALTNEKAKAFVVERTKDSQCSCTTYNPSGRCCLKDFPKQK